MKFILIVFLFCFYYDVSALSINIDNKDLIPFFDADTHVYNYYSDKDSIKINVTHENDEVVNGYGIYNIDDGVNNFYVNSSIYGEYKINVFKNTNYVCNGFMYFDVLNYDVEFNSNIYEYEIDGVDRLEFDYEVCDGYKVVISGNGNFNKSNNVIKVSLYKGSILEREYKFYIKKSITVFNEIHEELVLDTNKKEIVKLLIITISFGIIALFYKFIYT